MRERGGRRGEGIVIMMISVLRVGTRYYVLAWSCRCGGGGGGGGGEHISHRTSDWDM